MKIICIGDSLTFGYGIRKEYSWVSILNKSYDYEVINKGVNGDTSIGILSRFYTDVIIDKPDICIIMCGTNDLLLGRNIKSIIENIGFMLKDCSDNINTIVLSPPFILKDLAISLWDSSLDYDNINENIKSLSYELSNLCLVNKSIFIDLTNDIDLNYKNYTDGIHLSEEANKLIYKKIISRL